MFLSSGVVRACLSLEGDLAWRVPVALQWIWPVSATLGAFIPCDVTDSLHRYPSSSSPTLPPSPRNGLSAMDATTTHSFRSNASPTRSTTVRRMRSEVWR